MKLVFAFVSYAITLRPISYSHTTTEWSQPRVRSQVEEDAEDREDTVSEGNPEPQNHGEASFQNSER